MRRSPNHPEAGVSLGCFLILAVGVGAGALVGIRETSGVPRIIFTVLYGLTGLFCATYAGILISFVPDESDNPLAKPRFSKEAFTNRFPVVLAFAAILLYGAYYLLH